VRDEGQAGRQRRESRREVSFFYEPYTRTVPVCQASSVK